MFKRDLQQKLLYAAQKYPVVTITGPRQSGKTTIAKDSFPNYNFISLEDVDAREFAQSDPRTFLKQYQDGVIIDEVQHVPELFSYIQTHVDAAGIMGEYILTGSQHFLLMERITQSLAGRTAVLQLLPLSIRELDANRASSAFSQIHNGFYPAIYDRDIDPQFYYKNYINTYVERDVRQLKNIKDIRQFRNFLGLCAGRIGQLVNWSSLGNDCGIDQETVKSWISILETSYILFLLRPHHMSFNKRLTKQPKLYFYDTGLACHLLGIETPASLSLHYQRGALFENYVALELLKDRFNDGKDANIFFWRDHIGDEVDFIVDIAGQFIPVEVKSAETITSSLFDSLKKWKKLAQTQDVKVQDGYLVYSGEEQQMRSVATVIPWHLVNTIQNKGS